MIVRQEDRGNHSPDHRRRVLADNLMREIEVAAAIIIRDNKLLATERGYGDYKDWWEFPGGKLEAGETGEQALAREIREELDAEVRVGRLFCTVEHDYPKFHMTMYCYLCELISESITLVEHEAARWLTLDELETVKWLPSDVEIIDQLKEEWEQLI